MPTTLNEYVDKIFYRLSRGLPEREIGHYRSAIESTAQAALQDLADSVAASEEPKRGLLQKSFPFTLSGGEATLSAETNLLISTIPLTGYVTLSGVTAPLQWLPNRLDLDFPPNIGDFVFYTLLDQKIIVRDATGAIPSPTALTIHGSYVPTFADIPNELVDDDLIKIGLNLALGLGLQQPSIVPETLPKPEYDKLSMGTT